MLFSELLGDVEDGLCGEISSQHFHPANDDAAFDWALCTFLRALVKNGWTLFRYVVKLFSSPCFVWSADALGV